MLINLPGLKGLIAREGSPSHELLGACSTLGKGQVFQCFNLKFTTDLIVWSEIWYRSNVLWAGLKIGVLIVLTSGAKLSSRDIGII